MQNISMPKKLCGKQTVRYCDVQSNIQEEDDYNKYHTRQNHSECRKRCCFTMMDLGLSAIETAADTVSANKGDAL